MKAISYNTGFRRLDSLLTAIAYGVTSLTLATLAGLAGVLIAKFWLVN